MYNHLFDMTAKVAVVTGGGANGGLGHRSTNAPAASRKWVRGEPSYPCLSTFHEPAVSHQVVMRVVDEQQSILHSARRRPCFCDGGC